MMKHNEFIEGGALNSFGENLNFEGKEQSYPMKYQLFGLSIKDILDDKIFFNPTILPAIVPYKQALIVK